MNTRVMEIGCLGLLLLVHLCVRCQITTEEPDKYLLLGTRFNYGFIIAHTKAIEKAAASNPVGIQADLSWHFNSEKAYSHCNCLPRLGLSAYYWDYQNEAILGKAATILAFAEPFFNINRRVNFSIRPGIGLAYMTNPYDSINNPYNLAYSTHIGYSLLLNFTTYVMLTEQIIMNMSFNYNHISNGGVKVPNKGLNYPTLSLGLDYSFKALRFDQFNKNKGDHYPRRNRIIIAGFLGFKGLLLDDKTYNVYGLYSKYLIQVGRNSYLAEGMEFNIDQTKVKISEIYHDVDKNDRYIVALSSGYEHSLGKFSLTFDLGVYLRNPDQGKDIVFQRYGARMHVYKGGFIGINLRAHRHHAEFFDIRVGVRI